MRVDAMRSLRLRALVDRGESFDVGHVLIALVVRRDEPTASGLVERDPRRRSWLEAKRRLLGSGGSG
jgi:hypothetical protein